MVGVGFTILSYRVGDRGFPALALAGTWGSGFKTPDHSQNHHDAMMAAGCLDSWTWSGSATHLLIEALELSISVTVQVHSGLPT